MVVMGNFVFHASSNGKNTHTKCLFFNVVYYKPAKKFCSVQIILKTNTKFKVT